MKDRERLISLVSVTHTSDSIGQQIATESTSDIFAKLRSVSMSEWSQASQLGLSAAYQATVWSDEYSGEEYVDIDSKRYHVYRTYDTGDKMELYLEEMVGHGS